MNKLKWIAAVVAGWYLSQKVYARWMPARADGFEELEDVDAYNTDDQQGPFEEVNPRQRHL